MKILSLLLLFALAVSCLAQTTHPPDVSVLTYKWTQHNRARTVDGDLIRVNDDPFSANDRQQEWVENQKQIARTNAVRAQTGETALPPASRSTPNSSSAEAGASRGNQSTVEYAYEVMISNRGKKKIRRLDWAYVLTDPSSKREMGNHSFSSVIDVPAGKTKRIVERSLLPPAQIVDAAKPDTPATGQYVERVLLQRIEYDDGSVWQRVPK